MSFSEIPPFKETGQHSYHRRAFRHNYFAPFIYHIIIKKAVSCEPFGTIDGDARIAPGNQGCARVKESAIGSVIAKSILHLPYTHPILKLHQFCVMPDHVHLLLQVLQWSDYHLDCYIDSLKGSISTKISAKFGRPITEEDVFEKGYCDKPLYDNRSLDGLYRYIRENPHRLAMRQQYRLFFQRCRKLKIAEEEYEAYGNLFLFRNPDKEAVKISRKFSDKEKELKRERWISGASTGSILVSPFISKEEKLIRMEAEACGGKIILIIHEAFPQLYKPSAHDFELCEEGRLLIISLGESAKSQLTREICVRMNNLAETIANSHR